MFKRRKRGGAPSGDTGQEALYLKSLSERQVPISIKLRDGEVVKGWIEYFDDRMVRLTRDGKPNLFIYKEQIRTISESTMGPERRSGQRREKSVQGSPIQELPVQESPVRDSSVQES
ncbi:MAG: RNA chaperone Hfq [Bryocella sp.]